MSRETTMKITSFAVAVVAGFGLSVPVANSQSLPPVNMGKYVHKPGDNQYQAKSQNVRHHQGPQNTGYKHQAPGGGPAPGARSGGGGGGGGVSRGGGGYKRKRPKPGPDISLQSIPADEPIAPPGFPPLPASLDIPGVQNTTGLTVISSSSAGSYSGGSSGGAPHAQSSSQQGYGHYAPGAFAQKPNAAPRAAAPGNGGVSDPSFHQHYGHAAPGSFGQSGGGQSNGGGVGYYKCRSAKLPGRGDTFSSQAGNPTHKGAVGASMGGGPSPGGLNKALKKLGREPKLNDRVYGHTGAAPEAPTPVQINQASTQDLSLPDDDFQYRKPPSRGGRYAKRIFKRMGNRALNTMNSMPVPMKFGN